MISAYKNQKGMEEVIKSYNGLLKLWRTEYTEEDVPTSFGATHCILAGDRDKPPLLLLHGVGDNSAIMWPFNIGELSKHFFCIAVDTLGGPGKSVPGENFTKEKFTQRQWLNEVAAHYGLGQFNIAGVSNGAVMAFNYTVMEPEKVLKAICIEGGMAINPMKSILRFMIMMFPEILMPTRKNMIRIVYKLTSPKNHFYENHPEIVDHLLLLMKNHNRKAMNVHTVYKYDREASVRIYDKFYFLFGDVRMEERKELFNLLEKDGYKYKIIKDAGHGLNHEQAKAVNGEMVGFLAGLNASVSVPEA
ncbi:MAG TPA: alpha/beta hydrolase [Clostridia bacterium]|nr:alpha/beta hydrolase [Clostridia bacterium]